MQSKIFIILMASVVSFAMLVPSTFSEDVPGNNDRVKQGELALMLVNVLGLHRSLPAAPTEQQAIATLIANGIAPADGWEPGKDVTRADLARIIVLALNRGDDVEDPDQPHSWIEYLASLGVDLGTVGTAVASLSPMDDPISGNVSWVIVSTDPLQRRTVFGQPDESEMGTDLAFMPTVFILRLEEIIEIFQQIPGIPPRPLSPTPD